MATIESSRIAALRPWALAGTYLEACNCEAICPCRRIGGRPGGRSTYGVCMGGLSWAVKEGAAGEVDLSGLGAVMACRYDDDEPGSPWTFFLYVDERGNERQREALALILTGELGGTPLKAIPVGLEGEPHARLAPGSHRDRAHRPTWLVQGRGARNDACARASPRPRAGHLHHARAPPLGLRALRRPSARRRGAALVRVEREVRLPINLRVLVRRGVED